MILTTASISFCLLLTWSLFEFHFTEPHESSRSLVKGHLLILCEPKHIQTLLKYQISIAFRCNYECPLEKTCQCVNAELTSVISISSLSSIPSTVSSPWLTKWKAPASGGRSSFSERQ